jgi:hypothetical protein
MKQRMRGESPTPLIVSAVLGEEPLFSLVIKRAEPMSRRPQKETTKNQPKVPCSLCLNREYTAGKNRMM